MKKRSIVSLLLACTMALALTACGNSSNPGTTPNNSGTTGSGTTGSGTTGSGASGNTSGQVSYPKLSLNVSTSGGDTGIDTKAANRFAELISEATGGNITARIYPQAQLANGDQSKVAELLATGGSFEFGVCSGANLSSISESFQTHQLPYLFSSYEEAAACLDGAGGQAYADILSTKGLTYIGALHNGLRHWTNNTRPIKTPDDLKGLKMRIPSGEVGMAVFKAYGADPVTINFSELYTALQMGTADGQENGYDTSYGANLQEVQHYVTECGWQYDAWFVIGNTATLDSYDEATRAVIEDCWAQAIQWARDSMTEADAAGKQAFLDAGAEIYVPTADDMKAFEEAVHDVKMSFVDKYGEDICRAFGVIE